MFERAMVIQGLRRQKTLLENLIVEIEQKPIFDTGSLRLTRRGSRKISNNLRKLRGIKNQYTAFLLTESCS